MDERMSEKSYGKGAFIKLTGKIHALEVVS